MVAAIEAQVRPLNPSQGSFPTVLVNWLNTLWRGSIRLTTPMLFALGTVFVFGLGGLTGLLLGTISTDLYLHDTMYVVGHFHLTMASAVFLGSFAAIYFWFPKMYGFKLNSSMGKVHFWFSSVGVTAVFCMQMLAGFNGQQRRLYDPSAYTFLEHLMDLNRYTSYVAFVLGAAQLIFIVNLVRAFVLKEKAEKNPWGVGTLEWTECDSPPPVYNFDPIPIVRRGPHELSHPAIIKALGRDWVGQSEELPLEVEEPGDEPVLRPRKVAS